jgi:hypothetical protein
MVNGRGDTHNIADRSDSGDMELASVGTGVDHRNGQGQIPLPVFGNLDRKTAEICFMVLAKLLDPFSLVHCALGVRMSRQLDCSASWQAELAIEAGGVSLSLLPDQL